MAQVQGVHGRSRRPNTALGYALFGNIHVSLWMCILSEANSITKYSGDWCPWDAPELQQYLSLVTREESNAAMSLLFSSMWLRSTCPSGSAGSSEELQATHHRFTPPTKNCTGALLIHNIATISSYVCGRTNHHFVADMTVGRGSRTRIGA